MLEDAISINFPDTDETAVLRFDNIPSGVILYGTDSSNPYNLSNPAQALIPYETALANGINAKLPENLAGDVSLSLKVITTDASPGLPTSVLNADNAETVNVVLKVAQVADIVNADEANVEKTDGVEDAAIGSGNTVKFRVDANLTDTDGSEQLSIIVKLPSNVAGASFIPSSGPPVAGAVVTNLSGHDGQRVVSFDVESSQEKSGKYEFELVMEEHFSGSSSVEIIARSTDGDDTQDTNVGTHSFTVAPFPDPPIYSDGDIVVVAGSEDGINSLGTSNPGQLNVSMQFPDVTDEVHYIIFQVDSNVQTVTYNGETKTPETAAQNPSELTGISGTAVRFPVTANSDGSFNGVFDFVAVE